MTSYQCTISSHFLVRIPYNGKVWWGNLLQHLLSLGSCMCACTKIQSKSFTTCWYKLLIKLKGVCSNSTKFLRKRDQEFQFLPRKSPHLAILWVVEMYKLFCEAVFT